MGSIIATMAWNTWRHLEIWYGVMGLGAIVHTLNPRLFTDQLTYIINHAGDQWIFTDLSFVPLFEKLQDSLPHIKGFIIITDAAHMPAATTLQNPICYEELIADGDAAFTWPEFDENTACGMCYTSGTTGNPKGVLYSHRSNVLHGLMCALGDAMALSSRDVAMPVVPMFHANAWSIAFSAPIAGAALVMPGPKLDGASIYEMLMEGRVTHHRRRSHRLAHAAAISGAESRAQTSLSGTRHHRRLGLPGSHHEGIRGELRSRRDPRLGHDGDEPHRLARRAVGPRRGVFRRKTGGR